MADTPTTRRLNTDLLSPGAIVLDHGSESSGVHGGVPRYGGNDMGLQGPGVHVDVTTQGLRSSSSCVGIAPPQWPWNPVSQHERPGAHCPELHEAPGPLPFGLSGPASAATLDAACAIASGAASRSDGATWLAAGSASLEPGSVSPAVGPASLPGAAARPPDPVTIDATRRAEASVIGTDRAGSGRPQPATAAQARSPWRRLHLPSSRRAAGRGPRVTRLRTDPRRPCRRRCTS